MFPGTGTHSTVMVCMTLKEGRHSTNLSYVVMYVFYFCHQIFLLCMLPILLPLYSAFSASVCWVFLNVQRIYFWTLSFELCSLSELRKGDVQGDRFGSRFLLRAQTHSGAKRTIHVTGLKQNLRKCSLLNAAWNKLLAIRLKLECLRLSWRDQGGQPLI